MSSTAPPKTTATLTVTRGKDRKDPQTNGRPVALWLPADLVEKLDSLAEEADRSRSWVMRSLVRNAAPPA